MKQVVGKDYPEPLPLGSDEDMHGVILKRVTTGYREYLLLLVMQDEVYLYMCVFVDPCGTCRMGKDIEEGVVDGNLRVYGVKKLRVIDASIDPVIPDCRPQQVVYMTAEKVCSS